MGQYGKVPIRCDDKNEWNIPKKEHLVELFFWDKLVFMYISICVHINKCVYVLYF